MHSRHSRRPAACAPLAVLLLWADGASGYMSGTLARRAHAGDALRAPPVSAALSPLSAASGADGSSRMQQQQTQGKSMVTGALEAMLPGYVGRSRDTHAKREAQRASPTAHPTPLSRCCADAMDAACWLAGSAERGWLDPAQAQRLEVCVVGVGDGGRSP